MCACASTPRSSVYFKSNEPNREPRIQCLSRSISRIATTKIKKLWWKHILRSTIFVEYVYQDMAVCERCRIPKAMRALCTHTVWTREMSFVRGAIFSSIWFRASNCNMLCISQVHVLQPRNDLCDLISHSLAHRYRTRRRLRRWWFYGIFQNRRHSRSWKLVTAAHFVPRSVYVHCVDCACKL